MIVTAQMGETLDAVLWRIFGLGSGVVEQIYPANRGLAALGVVLPEGTQIIIPANATTQSTTNEVKLWN